METAKELKQNDYLLGILDEWIERYNTTPNHLLKDASLSIELNRPTQNLLKRPNTIDQLKKWAIENKNIVIITAVSIVVLTVAAAKHISENTSLESNEPEKGNHDFGVTKATYLSEINPGVYYAVGSNRILIDDANNKGVPNAALPERGLIDDALIKASFNQTVEEYMQAKLNEDELSKEASLASSESPEALSTDEPITSEAVVETPTVLPEGVGVAIVIPSYVRQTGLCRNYTSYTYFYGKWSKGTRQRTLSEAWGAAGKPSANGIATLNGRYLVAVSPKFGVVGDNIDIVLTDGQIIPATIADIKGRDATSEWGHVLITRTQAVDIIEWEATGAKSEINLGTWANVTVDRIINYGSLVPVYETTEELDPINAEAMQYITLYSEIYGLNADKIYEIISYSTNNFSGELYADHNVIETFGDSKGISCRSKEMAILLAVRDIYRNPRYYNVTAEEIKGNTLYYNSSSYEQQLEYFSNVLGVDSTLNYAICKAACDFNSPMFINQNNPTSIMVGGTCATFPTVAAGFVEQTVEVLEIMLRGEDPVEVIGARTNSLPDSGISDDLETYGYAMDNYDAMFGFVEISPAPYQRARLKKVS